MRPADTLPDGSPCGFLVRMEACPPSRYVTTVPGHAATVSTFRQIVRQPPPPPASAGGTTSGSGLADDSGDGAGADGGGGAAAAAASEVGELAEAVSPGMVALPVPTPSSISAADEAQLVNGIGRRMYPPAKGPVAPQCPPPPPRGDWALASAAAAAAAAAAVAAAVDGGEKASEAEQAADAQQSLGAQASASGGSPSSDAFSLGNPLGEEETALLKHLLDG